MSTPKVERAQKRVRRMIEDLEDLRDALDDFADGAIGEKLGLASNEVIAERLGDEVDRLWGAFIRVREPLHELRMRFVDAIERSTSVDEVRGAMLARCSRDDVARFTDAQITEALAVARKRGRQAGPRKWPTLARIVGAALSQPPVDHSGRQLKDEHRDWSDQGRRSKKRARQNSKPVSEPGRQDPSSIAISGERAKRAATR
jgi:hypothetical protein